ncbi:right-handed parallel beta-helix repeat-containing protein [Kitasatospora sp. NBC_00240]|uniref:right-handed parallel beta-helix repeat-containing protein n=1 Tax=Kitasatospora sp. NBC_00240 TaxID=2903567 RepID=UPI002255645F|nr:right-handed parallel beta-helix repeat-containing protein [Kitasatospora sp. NBC_00240]MCX5216011.1 right-handed parallel beta-helix repeat-containing protein [Kitasatospora sp. NBC_00240]
MRRTLLPRSARARRYPGVLLSALAFASAAAVGTVMPPTAMAASGGTTYYVSASGGSDQNAGTSSGSPWQSLAKVNATTFQPGDTILFKAGDSWSGQLWPKGSGAAGTPIKITQYGTGGKPQVKGAGTVADAVRLWNQHDWEIRNLDVSNNAPATGTPGANLGDFRGIHVGGDNGQQLNHFVIDSVDVHDVTGEIRWIFGTTPSKPGISWGNGWDRSKNTGGIVFNTTVANIASPPSTATVLGDVTIENSAIRNTSFAGIVFKQYTGDAPGAVPTGWGARTSATDPKYTPFTQVTVQHNYITQNGTTYGCNGMYITGVRNGTVQNNLVDRAGTSGIELFATDHVTVQHNEVAGTLKRAGGTDSNGIDTDIATTDSVVQYNYLHHNGEGYLACACLDNLGFGDAVFRYNVLANNADSAIHLANNPGSTTKLYNNTVYNTAPTMIYQQSTGATGGTNTFTNNIFHTTAAGATMVTNAVTTYNNNLYGGTSPFVPSDDTTAVKADPQFASPTAGGTGTEATGPALNAGLNWRIATTSPAVDAGITIGTNGGVDYNGAAVPVVPDLGALQHTPPAGTVFGDDFDALPTGALASGTDGWTVASTGNEVNVSGTPNSTDRSIQLVRRQDTGGIAGTNLTRTFPAPLTGTVTVEADVMRNDQGVKGDYFGLPYLYNSAGDQVVSVGLFEGNIVAYSGTTRQVIKPYAQGTWYHVKLVVDTTHQSFDFDLNGRRVMTAAPFRTTAPAIASMAFYANGGNFGSAYVNNVSVH